MARKGTPSLELTLNRRKLNCKRRSGMYCTCRTCIVYNLNLLFSSLKKLRGPEGVKNGFQKGSPEGSPEGGPQVLSTPI